jgi:small GTP-binding protein
VKKIEIVGEEIDRNAKQMSNEVNNEVNERMKVVLVGNSGVGKSTYVKMMYTGEYKEKHEPTVGCEVIPLDWLVKYAGKEESQVNRKSKGCKEAKLVIDVWDTAGNSKVGGLTEAYYNGADACICMFDVLNKKSFENLDGWIAKFRRVSNAPIYILGNKIDVAEIKIGNKKLDEFVCSRELKGGWLISAKSRYAFEKVFLEIAKLKFGENMLLYGDTSK